MSDVNRGDLERFVSGLASELGAIFRAADDFVKESADTLSEDFQVAAAVLEVFIGRACLVRGQSEGPG